MTKTLNYYQESALKNLKATSRTALNGTIDISAEGSVLKPLCKENYDSDDKRNTLKGNIKTEALDLDSLLSISQEEIKETVIQNFSKAIEKTYLKAKEECPFSDDASVKTFIVDIVKTLGKNIIKPESWMRKHGSKKFPYTESGKLEEVFDSFCKELRERIENMPKNSRELIENWGKTTAAWIEYRINLTDHFMSDSCGKTSAVLAAFVLIKADCALPSFENTRDYFRADVIPKMARNLHNSNENEDAQFQKWKDYYVSKFPKEMEKKNSSTPFIAEIIECRRSNSSSFAKKMVGFKENDVGPFLKKQKIESPSTPSITSSIKERRNSSQDLQR